jgi:hypothetical protein
MLRADLTSVLGTPETGLQGFLYLEDQLIVWEE